MQNLSSLSSFTTTPPGKTEKRLGSRRTRATAFRDTARARVHATRFSSFFSRRRLVVVSSRARLRRTPRIFALSLDNIVVPHQALHKTKEERKKTKEKTNAFAHQKRKNVTFSTVGFFNAFAGFALARFVCAEFVRVVWATTFAEEAKATAYMIFVSLSRFFVTTMMMLSDEERFGTTKNIKIKRDKTVSFLNPL